jgi:hypothetical protein
MLIIITVTEGVKINHAVKFKNGQKNEKWKSACYRDNNFLTLNLHVNITILAVFDLF